MGIFHYKILFLLLIVSLMSCIEDPLKSNIDDKYISAVTNSNGNLFVVTSEGKIYSSTDAVNWTNVPISNSIVLLDITSNENGIIVSTGDNGIFFISTNFGATWDKKSTGTGSFLKQIKIINDSTYIAGGRSGTLIKTTDYGENWSNITTPFNHNISTMTVDGDKIYIGLRPNKEQDSLLYIYDFLADTIFNSKILYSTFLIKGKLKIQNKKVYPNHS